MMTHLLALIVGFIAGALVMRKHRVKIDAAENKGKSVLKALKGR